MPLRIAFSVDYSGEIMVLGEKLWEGKGKSGGPGFIKSIDIEGVKSVYAWSAQLKGFGCAEGVDCMVQVTADGMQPPKGIGREKDQGVMMTMTGEMAVIKGHDLSKMSDSSGKPVGVGLWSFMTMSEKLSWMNNIIAVITMEALDPMWETSNITIYEWKT
jgi:hypothetical protein